MLSSLGPTPGAGTAAASAASLLAIAAPFCNGNCSRGAPVALDPVALCDVMSPDGAADVAGWASDADETGLVRDDLGAGLAEASAVGRNVTTVSSVANAIGGLLPCAALNSR